MIAPFSKRYTGTIITLFSLAPILTHYFLGQIDVIAIIAIWLSSATFAYGIRNVIVRYNLGSQDNNHVFPISIALFSPIFVFLYTEFQINPFEFLLQALGFLCIQFLITESWQQKICPVSMVSIGLIIGLECALSSNAVLWLLLVPAILYIMRSLSGRNLGSVVTGFVLSVWLTYLFNFFLQGEAIANNVLFSFSELADCLFNYDISFSIIEWIFVAFLVLLIIIYYIYGYFYNAAKTVRGHSNIISFSVLGVLLLILAMVDVTHVPNYAALITIIFAFQLSILQSCKKDASTEWWIVIVLLIFLVLSVFSPIFVLFF